jgi:hypothetical protein
MADPADELLPQVPGRGGQRSAAVDPIPQLAADGAGGTHASEPASVQADLTAIRQFLEALDRYAAHHASYPFKSDGGAYVCRDVGAFTEINQFFHSQADSYRSPVTQGARALLDVAKQAGAGTAVVGVFATFNAHSPGDWPAARAAARELAGHLVALSSGHSAAQRPRSRGKRVKSNLDKLNAEARRHLESNPTVKAKELADLLDCAVGLIPKLPAWQVVMQARRAGRTPKAPRTVRLTKTLEGMLGENDRALQGLIAEQGAEMAKDARVPAKIRRRGR